MPELQQLQPNYSHYGQIRVCWWVEWSTNIHSRIWIFIKVGEVIFAFVRVLMANIRWLVSSIREYSWVATIHIQRVWILISCELFTNTMHIKFNFSYWTMGCRLQQQTPCQSPWSEVALLYYFDQMFMPCHLSPQVFTRLGVYSSAITQNYHKWMAGLANTWCFGRHDIFWHFLPLFEPKKLEWCRYMH
jgi:hypothetical protein